jgi:OmcA/MtrC family decaheme c-type cytochrome
VFRGTAEKKESTMTKHGRLTLNLLVIAIIAALTASLAAATDTGRRRAVAPQAPSKAVFTPDQMEAYLAGDVINYILPGLKIKVNSVTIGSNRVPVVDLNITDDFDQPIDRLGKTTPGAVSISLIMAWYDPATRQYTSYTTRTQTSPATSPRPNVTAIQAAADSGGTFTDLETGHAKYTFKTALPANFDQTRTHTLGIYATRNMTDTVGKSYYANVEYDFRPDGVKVTEVWDKMREASTCNSCHNPLSAHGGSRRDVKLCVLCHTPQTSDPDTGNTVDFKVMVHKIHAPGELSTPLVIYGNAQSVHDFSGVTYPQDVRNCKTCHEGSVPASKGLQSEVWYTKPARDACGSCHDDINWATGAKHAGGAQANDNSCASCHQPESSSEFDASIKGAHTIPTKSKQLKGITAAVVSVKDMAPGKKPTAVFALKNGDGTPIDPTKLATFSPIVGGPTSSYSWYRREEGRTTGVYDSATGNLTFTFANALPSDAAGTWTVSADIRRNATLKRGDGGVDIAVQESTINPIKYTAITGTISPRRTVVTLAQCNSCHETLSLHGGQRNTTEECVICHNPVENDSARRVANAGPPESVSFQRMIHRIHTGEELTQDYTVYAFGGVPTSFNEVKFPGDRRDCAKCHSGNSHLLPLPTGIANVTTLRDYFTSQGPATAACLGCHDGRDAAAHAYLNTVTFPGTNIPAEACATCHGTGKEWAVEKMHAR